jgi:outer membrane murein-binding lipoprotein Lpp
MENRMKFEIKIDNIEKVNPLFSKCKIYALYTDLNRNNSFISEQAVNESLGSIYNTPIVGEYIEESDNFGGHGGKVEITDGEIKYVQTTKPYGVIPESAKIYWEDIKESNGKVNKYLVIEDAYLWTSRYPEVEMLIGQKFGQSMEIEVLDAEFTTVNNKKVWNIKKFLFSAFCILGINKESDPDGHVEPCFESASIVAYSLDNDEFKKQFYQMIKELKFSLEKEKIEKQDNKGGVDVEQLQELLKKYNLTLEDLAAKKINHEEFSLEDLENKIKEAFEIEEDAQEIVSPNESSKDDASSETDGSQTQFALTSEQLKMELQRRIYDMEKIKSRYDETYEYPRYYYIDHMPDKNVVVAFDYKEGYMVGCSYSLTGDQVDLDLGSVKRYRVDYVPMEINDGNNQTEVFIHSEVIEHQLKEKEFELTTQFSSEKESLIADYQAKIDSLESQLNTLKTQYDLLEAKANELDAELVKKAQKEREEAENALFALFADKLTEEEMLEIKSRKAEMSLEDLEKELKLKFAEKALQIHSLEEQGNANKPLRFNLDNKEKKSSGKSYDDLFEKYKKQ